MASEVVVRYGDYLNNVYAVRVFVDMNINDYDTAVYAIGCRSAENLLPVVIFFNGKRELQSFVNELKAIRDKYAEWLAVAQSNEVTKLDKVLPTQISARKLTYYDGNMEELKTVIMPLKALFRAEYSSLSLLPVKNITFGFAEAEPEAIPIFHVCSVEDLDQILSTLDIEQIKQNVDAKVKTSNLFN